MDKVTAFWPISGRNPLRSPLCGMVLIENVLHL
jgi:hypothetical protein